MEILKLNTGGAVGSKIRLRRSAQNFCEVTVSSVLCAIEMWVEWWYRVVGFRMDYVGG